MKFKVTFKDPDVVDDAIREAHAREVAALPLSKAEQDGVIDQRCEETSDKLGRWVECGEYITVEFDTEAMTAIVVPRK